MAVPSADIEQLANRTLLDKMPRLAKRRVIAMVESDLHTASSPFGRAYQRVDLDHAAGGGLLDQNVLACRQGLGGDGYHASFEVATMTRSTSGCATNDSHLQWTTQPLCIPASAAARSGMTSLTPTRRWPPSARARLPPMSPQPTMPTFTVPSSRAQRFAARSPAARWCDDPGIGLQVLDRSHDGFAN